MYWSADDRFGRGRYQSLLKGKGFSPGYETKDKDLIIPIREEEEPNDPWPHLEEGCSELVELLAVPAELDRWPVGMPRAHGRDWDDDMLTPAPKDWIPRKG